MGQEPRPLRIGCLAPDEVSLNLEEKSLGLGTQTSQDRLPGSWRWRLGICGRQCERMGRRVWGSWFYKGWKNCKQHSAAATGRTGPVAAEAKKHIWDNAFGTTSRQRAPQRSLSHFDRSQHTGIPETSCTPANSMICLFKPINLPMCAYSYSNQVSVTCNQKSPA